MLCVYTGTEESTLESAIKCVRDQHVPTYYDTEKLLLEHKCVENHPDDVERCYAEMFNYWLEVDSKASCIEVMNALKQTEQNTLAAKVKYVIPSMLNAIHSYVRTYVDICVHRNGLWCMMLLM